MRVFTHIVLFYTFILHWWFLAVPLLFWISMRYGAGGIVMLAFLADGYFGNYYSWPVLSMLSLVWYVIAIYIRPRLVSVPKMIE